MCGYIKPIISTQRQPTRLRYIITNMNVIILCMFVLAGLVYSQTPVPAIVQKCFQNAEVFNLFIVVVVGDF